MGATGTLKCYKPRHSVLHTKSERGERWAVLRDDVI